MLKLIYSDIENISDKEFEKFLELIPKHMVSEIAKCRSVNDKKLKLISRIILMQCLQQIKQPWLIDKWQRDNYNKPFIRGWEHFNITHSGKFVVFAHHAISSVGIDIERIENSRDMGIIKYFHKAEQEFILGSPDPNYAFYEIWVKKEAFLKAIGIGLTNGIISYNCINNHICYNGDIWYFHKFRFNSDYICYACTLYQEAHILLEKFKFC